MSFTFTRLELAAAVWAALMVAGLVLWAWERWRAPTDG